MSRIEYELLREDGPDLALPVWDFIGHGTRSRILGIEREQFIGRRIAAMLSAEVVGQNNWHFYDDLPLGYEAQA